LSIELIEAGPDGFAALIAGQVPQGVLRLAESELAPQAVLEMLAELSTRMASTFWPNAWMIVDHGTVAGLVTLVREPSARAVTIGYGIAESDRGRGLASRAVGMLLQRMTDDERVDLVLAETVVENQASQHVLRANGFSETGRRSDSEDGELICWSADVSKRAR